MAKELTKGQQILMKKLKAEQAKNMSERARKKITKDSGTLTSRVEKAKKSQKQKGGVPALRRETPPAVRKENLPAKRDGGSRSIVKRESGQMVVREGKGNLPAKMEAPKGGGAGGAFRKMLPGAWRLAGGPATMLVAQTLPAGEGSDKPTGPLMKGGKQSGYKYRDAGAMSTKDAEKQYRRMINPTSRPNSQARDEVKAPIPKARPAESKPRPTFAKKADVPKVATKAEKRPSFRGNWAGAAPTAMQARGGARVKRENLMDFLRKKK